jgi:hypothetical protein
MLKSVKLFRIKLGYARLEKVGKAADQMRPDCWEYLNMIETEEIAIVSKTVKMHISGVP